MPRAHDRGGWPTDAPIDRSEHRPADWERRIDALFVVLTSKNVIQDDEVRRGREDLPPEDYERMAYYERFVPVLERLLEERGIFAHQELERKLAELEAREASR